MTKNTIIILTCILSFIEGGLVSNIVKSLANHYPIPLPIFLLVFGIAFVILAGILTITGVGLSDGKPFIDSSWKDKCVEEIKAKWEATR